MGKSCVRFNASAELALDVIGEVIAKTPVSAHVAKYLATRGGSARRATTTRPSASAKSAGAKNPQRRAKPAGKSTNPQRRTKRAGAKNPQRRTKRTGKSARA